MKQPLLVIVRNFLHRNVVEALRYYYVYVWGMQIGKGCRLSLRAKLDKTNPRGVVIGEYTALTFGSALLTHDFVNRRHLTTKIGSYCFIGCGSTIMPGVTIGDHCIIGANTLVVRDVPPHSAVMGNPGRVVERDIQTTFWGIRVAPTPLVAAAE